MHFGVQTSCRVGLSIFTSMSLFALPAIAAPTTPSIYASASAVRGFEADYQEGEGSANAMVLWTHESAQASASGNAGNNTLHAYANGHMFNGYTWGSGVQAAATVMIVDVLSWDSGVGKVTYKFDDAVVNGSFEASASRFDAITSKHVGYRVSIEPLIVSGPGEERTLGSMAYGNSDRGEYDVAGLVDFDAYEFDTSQEYIIRTYLTVSVSVHNWDNSAGGFAKAVADFAHTAYWGGVAWAADENGNPIDLKINSALGIDYNNASPRDIPVPEPAAISVLGVGLLSLGLRRRRPGLQRR